MKIMSGKLKRKRKRSSGSSTSFIKMNLRLNRAWKSIRGWWREEDTEVDDDRGTSVENDEPRANSNTNCIKSRQLSNYDSKKLDVGLIDEDGYCNVVEEPSSPYECNGKIYDAFSTCERGARRRASSTVSERRRNPSAKYYAYSSYSYLPRPPQSRIYAMNSLHRSIRYPPQGQDGFEDLRRYIKQGGDFCKELSTILQERCEAEFQYAKTLSKLSNKLLKVSKEAVGTVSQAWHKAGMELETSSEIHKTFATALCEDVVKPLKQLLDSQHRIRKSVENAVDKTGRILSEWRTAESKSKKRSFMNARENEKLQDMSLDVRLNGANKLTASSLLIQQRQGNEKDSSKLETKRKKAEESIKKSDVEYYSYCIRAERARLEWETAVVRGCRCFQALEEERLQQLKHMAYVYWQHCRDIGPKLSQSASNFQEPVSCCNVAADIKTVSNTKGIKEPVSEQSLPDFYAEHFTLAMNKDRRRQALNKLLQLVMKDLEKERRGKNGVENLARAFKQSPNFSNDDSQQNVSEKLHHMRFMLTYLEAARHKILCALAELEGKPKPSHPLASHIYTIRDRQGFQQSFLKVPSWVHTETIELNENSESLNWPDRGTADGNSAQPESDFDEFSSQESSEKDFTGTIINALSHTEIGTVTSSNSGKCKVLYQYVANSYDELNLQPGDMINIHDRQPDGWWLGELNGVVGIFPATYVEEIS